MSRRSDGPAHCSLRSPASMLRTCRIDGSVGDFIHCSALYHRFDRRKDAFNEQKAHDPSTALGLHAATFEALLEAAPDAMVGAEQGGTIQFVNRQTELLFGYDRAHLVGQSIETLVPESFRTVHPAYRAGYFADPKTRPMGASLELTGWHRDGTEFPVDVSLL